MSLRCHTESSSEHTFAFHAPFHWLSLCSFFNFFCCERSFFLCNVSFLISMWAAQKSDAQFSVLAQKRNRWYQTQEPHLSRREPSRPLSNLSSSNRCVRFVAASRKFVCHILTFIFTPCVAVLTDRFMMVATHADRINALPTGRSNLLARVQRVSPHAQRGNCTKTSDERSQSKRTRSPLCRCGDDKMRDANTKTHHARCDAESIKLINYDCEIDAILADARRSRPFIAVGLRGSR